MTPLIPYEINSEFNYFCFFCEQKKCQQSKSSNEKSLEKQPLTPSEKSFNRIETQQTVQEAIKQPKLEKLSNAKSLEKQPLTPSEEEIQKIIKWVNSMRSSSGINSCCVHLKKDISTADFSFGSGIPDYDAITAFVSACNGNFQDTTIETEFEKVYALRNTRRSRQTLFSVWRWPYLRALFECFNKKVRCTSSGLTNKELTLTAKIVQVVYSDGRKITEADVGLVSNLISNFCKKEIVVSWFDFVPKQC